MNAPKAPAGSESDWLRCPGCAKLLYRRRLSRDSYVCSDCGHHLPLTVEQRLEHLLDAGSLRMLEEVPGGGDPLEFCDTRPYPARLEAARRRTGRTDAIVTGHARVDGCPVVVAALDFAFMGGSVGTMVGDMLVAAAVEAGRTKSPLLIVSASGGARMQEGALSLMQLARTSQEIARLREAGVLVLNLNTHATYGGATASFSSLGDIILAEPGALIGFAGPQVIRQTIGQDLPPGFQTAEFLHERGMVDRVVPREQLRDVVGTLLRLHRAEPSKDEELTLSQPDRTGITNRRPAPSTGTSPGDDVWSVVAMARSRERPTTLDYIHHLCDDFVELHGDRIHGDDQAIVGGLARLGGRSVMVIGHQKAPDTAGLVRRNFGMPHPEGYRKAMRLMRHAGRFALPVVTFVDTPGAYPGIEAEERGQGAVIAECIASMARLRVPVVSVVTGEGGSGGALALAVGNRVLMLSNGYYSVISPEGCSTILWGSAERAATAARALRITAEDLLELGVIDTIVSEPDGGAQAEPEQAIALVGESILAALAALADQPGQQLLDQRYERFLRFGRWRHDGVGDLPAAGSELQLRVDESSEESRRSGRPCADVVVGPHGRDDNKIREDVA